MTHSLFMELELCSPVAVTAHSATVGGHESLTWIPGGQLLGATAAAIRRRPDSALPDEVWRILLSGEVRFGDAWPSADGRPAFPVPLAFHTKKGEKEPVFNLVTAERSGKGQLEQVRDRHVSADGRTVWPRRHHTLRTAIEEDGRAREGFLFGIQALEAGQCFLSRIDADDPALLARVAALLDGQEIAVGRSRSAEFGRVMVRTVSRWDEQAPPSAPASELVLWLVADLALRDDRTGAPRLQLTPDDLGLSGWDVIWERSFVRTRRYSPFNGARRRPDLERQLVRPGSVFVLRGPELDADRLAGLARRLERGIGDHVQEGFGRMLVNPRLLAADEARLCEAAVVSTDACPTMPDDLLGRWLHRRAEQVDQEAEVVRQARSLEADFRHRGIGRSQWGEVRRMSREARFDEDPQHKLRSLLAAFLKSGARLHLWPEDVRRALLERAARTKPAALELASTLLARRHEEQP